MNRDVYYFKVGALECMAVSDGTHTYAPPIFPPPGTFLFANAARDELEIAARRHHIQLDQWAEWVSPYICLLINTGEQLVLVDTGAGDLAPSTGRLLNNLRAEGIDAEDIDMVILTHGHPDHIGGNTAENGQLVFPNARYAMWKEEWDFWTSEETAAKLDEHSREVLMGFARKNLPPIKERLVLIEREEEIVPGIKAIATPGHTPGHMTLAISSEGEQLLNIADAVLHPIHIEHPEWCAVLDYQPDQIIAARQQLLDAAATDEALVLAFHFPFPGLGHIVTKGEGWEWRPLEANK